MVLIDLFPPTSRDPQGIHGAIWKEIAGRSFKLPRGKRLTAVAYTAAEVTTAYVEPLAVGDVLIDMPLFLNEDRYISLPLESTYQNAWQGFPMKWQKKLA